MAIMFLCIIKIIWTTSWVDNDLALTKILKYDNSDVENTSGVEIGI
ncbi:hypothetical protein [uncultured Eubacterium sp.]|nr:hypothetical protein [uncultured Eubacterium sp.]